MNAATRTHHSATTALPTPLGLAGAVLARLAMIVQIARERRALSALDARTLQDIGVNEADAAHEAGRALWDLPTGR